MSSPTRIARARLAASTRHHPEADHTELRRQLKAQVLADYIARKVAEAPPLTSDQRARLATLLRGAEPPDRPDRTQAAGGTTSAEANGQTAPSAMTI